MAHHYMKMNLIDGSRVCEREAGFEGLFCTSIMKPLFCMCSHLSTRLTIVMKVPERMVARFHLVINLKVTYLLNLQSDICFHSPVAMALLARIHLRQMVSNSVFMLVCRTSLNSSRGVEDCSCKTFA